MAGGVWGGEEETLIINQWYWIIPNSVLFDEGLTDKQKLLFCLVSSLCAEKWFCWATNDYLWQLLNVCRSTISKNISILHERWLIKAEIENKFRRKITLVKNDKPLVKNDKGDSKKSERGVSKKSEDNIISNNITKEKEISSKEEIEKLSYGNKDINNLIDQIKQECDLLGIAYDKQDDRNFARHILTAKEYWAFCEKIWQDRVEFAINILKASVGINYWKICSWPMLIYKNYVGVYNETLKYKAKNSKNLIQSF